MNERYELLVKTRNPKLLDHTVQQFGGVVGQDAHGHYDQIDTDIYTIRSVMPQDNSAFLNYIILVQGYGDIVGKRLIPESESQS